jgi:two-component system cell cycle response regulator
MKPAQILVVDDNATNLKLVSELLAFEGYDVLNAMDAEAAQVVLATALPNLILMDIALPGMDGLSLTRLLKADPRTCHIRIVALTAFAMKGDEQKAIDAGCDGYITKPIDTRALPVLLNRILAFPDVVRKTVMNILVIEDQPSQMKLAQRVLSFEGHHVSAAGAAESAFGAIRADRPEIILLDLGLPGMDGLTLVRKLKADPATRDIHIVAVTSYSEEFQKSAALAAGCDAYIQKPINTRELGRQLNGIAAHDALRGNTGIIPSLHETPDR